MKRSIFNSINAVSSPTSSPPKKSSRKTLIVAVVIILIVALVAGVYFATRGNSGTNSSATPTPTSSSSATPNPSTSGTGSNVAGASSLQFTASVTNSSGELQETSTYYAKDIGTSNIMLRMELTDSSGNNFVYIVNGAQQKAWMESGGQWIDISASYTSQLSSLNKSFTLFQTNLAGWTGVGDWTYTSSGGTARVYNISVNPSLSDSLFTPS